ncbi:ABC transporter permease [Xinfangfangia sp. CPCC 101601]|uniref:ABC transporter permease n=1 Tax=Pseudogemmobacter lacusdianii TaxID=3069608 RepID=A0ABU0VTR2_9RHOB|nr:ABC transporter permease [Xinfangfangia sp. CPCC 101601]MDQ2065119.1 ABC transporter permease [Xinfangfangia sp. CPCC 101601]
MNTQPARIALLAFPAFWILLLHLGPMLAMLRISFLESFPPLPGSAEVATLANYTAFFANDVYIVPMLRTLVFSFSATLLLLVLTYPLAFFLAKGVRAERKLTYLMILFAPFWVGEIIRIFSITVTFGNRGAVNWVLLNLGILERPLRMLYGYFSLSTGIIHLSALYMLMPIYAAIEKIPDNLLEAGRDLGAGPVSRFFDIILPLSREGVATGCALVFLANVGTYSVPALLGGPGTSMFSETIGTFFHTAGSQWPVGSAFSVLLLTASLTIAALMMLVIQRRKGRAR